MSVNVYVLFSCYYYIIIWFSRVKMYQKKYNPLIMSITTHLIVMFTTILYFIRHCCCCCFWDGDTLCCFVLHNMCRKWSETDDQQRKKNSQPGNGSLCIQTWYETYSILIPWVKNHWRLVFITCWLPFQFFFFLHNFSLFLFFSFFFLYWSCPLKWQRQRKKKWCKKQRQNERQTKQKQKMCITHMK